MKVEVRPLEQNKWHGKKNKESFFEPKTIQVLYNPSTGAYATGLTAERAAELSKKLGVDLSDSFNPEQEHPFWSTKSAQIKLENKTMFFDSGRPFEEIKIANMKASKYVANSLKEYDEGKWPEATHVIYDEEEDVTLKAGKMQKNKKAMKLLASMDLDSQINIVQIIMGKSLRGRSQNFVDAEMEGILEDHIDEFISYAQMSSKDVYNKAIVLEAISRNILTKDAGAVFYMSERIGFSVDDAVAWFADPNNQTVKAAILEKIND